ncbi:hypothetical protein DKX38_002764 [Salix brachista]|uniref:E3 ubiquitin-protein ligase RMA n=1 Tax=Salix brachista TaxID=2182728 RepID=A0A5N5NQY1_9ROSI|nr:hypothetical protein DKX38_002764 [Salix brachista]
MASGFGESTSRAPQNTTFTSNNGNGDAGNFECNICFDLAQDPIVTLCGHLFCWPCVYKWLHFHSKSRECPVCKALVEEKKLVPLYGRGKTSTDPRSKSIPSVNIPNRPAGQRPETAPPPEPNHFGQQGFGFMGGLGGFAPMATARFGNFTFSAAFGGLIPSLFNLQVHGFPDAAMYGPASFPYGFNSFNGGHPHGFHPHHADPLSELKLLTDAYGCPYPSLCKSVRAFRVFPFLSPVSYIEEIVHNQDAGSVEHVTDMDGYAHNTLSAGDVLGMQDEAATALSRTHDARWPPVTVQAAVLTGA